MGEATWCAGSPPSRCGSARAWPNPGSSPAELPQWPYRPDRGRGGRGPGRSSQRERTQAGDLASDRRIGGKTRRIAAGADFNPGPSGSGDRFLRRRNRTPVTKRDRISIERLSNDVTVLHESYARGRLMREGARVAIVGKPNVGKSSIMNLLLGTDRAIVTPFPEPPAMSSKTRFRSALIPWFSRIPRNSREFRRGREIGIERSRPRSKTPTWFLRSSTLPRL